jgi:hypothetical protein
MNVGCVASAETAGLENENKSATAVHIMIAAERADRACERGELNMNLLSQGRSRWLVSNATDTFCVDRFTQTLASPFVIEFLRDRNPVGGARERGPALRTS